uniref:Ovule protein n=1 Tax=Panagrolaimus sp. PS1159 TaxID=55785 RepID=A0AC35GPY5_9BILA
MGVGFYRYERLRSVECKSPRLYEFSRYMYVILGTLELIFMIALSVVGEREFIQYHVIFFYLFGMFATGFFIANVVCHANSLYYLNPYVMYDIFAITEYVDVFLSIIYHSCAFYDIRHKVIFSIRHVKNVKKD